MNYIERNRDFKGVWIPKEIWLNDKLTMLEKVILIEIDSLDNEDHCVAGNEYLAQFCQCSESKVTGAIRKLKDLGYIEIVSYDGRHRKIRSRLLKSTSQTNKKYESESEKVRAINIANSIDNSLAIYNAETSSAHESSSDNQNSPLVESTVEESICFDAPPTPPPAEEKFTAEVKDIIDYLNLKTNRRYRANNESAKKHIVARLKQEYTVDDFKHVIDVKSAEWMHTEMENYLRPETLFGSKFDNYLNSRIVPKSKNDVAPLSCQKADPAKIRRDLKF